jgi:hypothetical protein
MQTNPAAMTSHVLPTRYFREGICSANAHVQPRPRPR